MKLTDQIVSDAAPKVRNYKLSDGNGLFVVVTPLGTKYWRWKYFYNDKEKSLSIGAFPEITVLQARASRDKALADLKLGIDPSVQKQIKKQVNAIAVDCSFEIVAREWFAIRMVDKSKTHQKRCMAILESYLFPSIGRFPANEIKPVMLLGALRKIENKGIIETANRARQIAGQVFSYAVITGRAENNPAINLRGALKVPIKGHHAAITEPTELGRFLTALESFRGSFTVVSAIRASVLWFCRPGELCKLKWADVNWEKKRIEYTASKTAQAHIIPLASQSVRLLQELTSASGSSPFIFASPRGKDRAIALDSMRMAMRSMGFSKEDVTTHGFRATARTLLDEELGFRIDWIEQQLAHTVRDPNGRAYNRTSHLEQRFVMMQAWADYLDKLTNIDKDSENDKDSK
ncbi:MAG: integrase arm-type DNA-binding domain-containing protein [Gammaproteobacteria bacterium]|nr:integrase arm-type DNA-binding domain-containing protein [Gammaproteobacteria bacterium]MBU2205779.1 integrase arm-type DNA-binding domain-containing protein [Gammaproteobacteria bacterium]